MPLLSFARLSFVREFLLSDVESRYCMMPAATPSQTANSKTSPHAINHHQRSTNHPFRIGQHGLTHWSLRHKRTHERMDGSDGPVNFSGEEEEDFSGEDQLGSLEEASPGSENAYITASLNGVANEHSANVATPQTFNSLQTLSMPMTLSQPALNSGLM